MKKIKILESGIADLEIGKKFYEEQCDGIGSYFLESAFSEIESLKLHGGIHSIHFGFHRMLLRRFPFAVYYELDGEFVIVFRVLDCRKNPSYIKKQLTP